MAGIVAVRRENFKLYHYRIWHLFDTSKTPVLHLPRHMPRRATVSDAGTIPQAEEIQIDEYQQRRQRVLKALNGAAAVVFAGEGSPPLLGRWQAEHHFVYLTGIENEAGAAVLFDPSADDPKR